METIFEIEAMLRRFDYMFYIFSFDVVLIGRIKTCHRLYSSTDLLETSRELFTTTVKGYNRTGHDSTGQDNKGKDWIMIRLRSMLSTRSCHGLSSHILTWSSIPPAKKLVC